MLAKNFRFKNFDFKLFFNNQNQIIKNDFFLIYKINNFNKQKKFSVLVKNKLYKKSVERNKIKRRIYEIIRKNLDKIDYGYYLIILLKKNSKYQILEEKLLKLLIK